MMIQAAALPPVPSLWVQQDYMPFFLEFSGFLAIAAFGVSLFDPTRPRTSGGGRAQQPDEVFEDTSRRFVIGDWEAVPFAG